MHAACAAVSREHVIRHERQASNRFPRGRRGDGDGGVAEWGAPDALDARAIGRVKERADGRRKIHGCQTLQIEAEFDEELAPCRGKSGPLKGTDPWPQTPEPRPDRGVDRAAAELRTGCETVSGVDDIDGATAG